MCAGDDPYTGEVALCEGGKMADGFPCTGHAHAGGEHLRCADPSHDPVFDGSTVVLTIDGQPVPPLPGPTHRTHPPGTLAVDGRKVPTP